jgi:hypothetical protein
MKTSMTLFSCGPKLALLCLPYIILSLIVMYIYPEFFDLRFQFMGKQMFSEEFLEKNMRYMKNLSMRSSRFLVISSVEMNYKGAICI